nr:hypothetical protein [Pseudobdellovibrionaceae bacterium]
SLKDLIREVKLTLFELQSDLQCEITQIYLSGGVSQLKNLTAYLTQWLEIPVNRYKPLIHPTGISFENLGTHFTIQSIALGYAIEGLKKAKNPPLNFRKGEFAKQNVIFKEYRQSLIQVSPYLASTFVLLFLFANLRTSMSEDLVNNSKSTLKAISKNIPELGKKSGPTQAQRYIREKKSAEKQIEELKNISKMNTGLDLLEKLSTGLSKSNSLTYHISSLNINDQMLHIEGFANSALTIAEIKKMLTLQSIDQKVSSVSSQYQSGPRPNRIPFAFELMVDRGLETKKKQRKF